MVVVVVVVVLVVVVVFTVFTSGEGGSQREAHASWERSEEDDEGQRLEEPAHHCLRPAAMAAFTESGNAGLGRQARRRG